MTREELVEKAKELSELEDLTGKGGEIANLKRQWRKIRGDDDSLYEKELTDKFNKYFEKLSSAEDSLNAGTYEEKKGLIAKAKALLDTKDFKKASVELNTIFDDFKNAGRCTKEQNDELWTEFKAIKDEFYAKKSAHYQEVSAKLDASKLAKEQIIEEAKEALKIEDIRELSKKMDELMEKWKTAGYAGKEHDDNLWASFKEIRKEYYDKRSAYFDAMKAVYAERVEKKQDIIARARKGLANSSFTHEEIEEMKHLRVEWKEVGHAGKNNEDALWEEFNGVTNKYFQALKESK